MGFDGLMVSVSGVRGRVGEALTPEVIATYAAAFGAWASRNGNRRVVVGRDSRVSGPMFTRIVHGALESVGCTVIDIGMAPTPTIQLAVEHHHAAGGLGITASHNPIEWNALKFIGASGLFLSAAEGAEMRALLETGIPRATWDELGHIERDDDAVARHLEQLLALPWLDVDAIRAARFRVALDCCHGAGSVIMPQLLTELGCEVYAINMEADGKFHRPPEPVAENLGELAALVKATQAHIGFATDPDVDRLALVLDDGVAPGEDYTLAFAARTVLKHRPGPVVTNLSTSKVVSDVAAEFGVPFQFAKVGEVNVAIAMRDAGATIGGEGNGGVILPEMHLGRDAPVGAALMLQLMVEEGRPLSELVASKPRYVIVKDKLDRPDAPLDAVYEALRAAFPDAVADTQDGLRLDWSDRWVHLRPSGTEPIVRVIAEAPSDADARLLIAQAREPLAALV
ncbi:phosphoglucosamine mutase [Gemmatimonas sp.]|uniref:phosphoglucosamine mutase n=1 Tax=Gemmatimonas sp. TaxID=1962908 RepID=UPI00333F082D